MVSEPETTISPQRVNKAKNVESENSDLPVLKISETPERAIKDFNEFCSPQLVTKDPQQKNKNPNPMAESLHIPDMSDFRKLRKTQSTRKDVESKLRKDSGHKISEFHSKILPKFQKMT